ncbi:phage major capsid protein [Bacillus inaquosorum]|uniref:major capsid protein n=1 Tax=Bacillus inaquosorum TaxID=483913 RepID=UPI00227EDFD1|nr:phage major capsid protein [Bacillus inaquosorum]MCY9061003.1 phage major capsid protein [Bacillus inaquosorum]
MAISLVESAKLTQDALKKGVITEYAQNSAALEILPFIEMEGNAFSYNREGALPGIDFRAVNEAYKESSGTVNNQVARLAILGGDVDVDKFIAQTRSNINDQRMVQTSLKVKAFARFFEKNFIDGDVGANPNGFDGLKKLTTTVVDAGENGNTLTLSMLDELLDAVDGGPNVLLMSKEMRRNLKALIQAENGYFETGGYDAFGRPVLMYGGVPIRTIGKDTNNAEILGFNETQGTSTDTGSIYALRVDEADGVAGITNGGVQVYDLGELQQKPAYRTRIEFYAGMVVQNSSSAARLKGVQRKI